MLISRFRIYWCVLDGAECNRQFIKMHFKNKDVIEEKFVTCNIYSGRPMVFLMDPKVSIYAPKTRFRPTIVDKTR